MDQGRPEDYSLVQGARVEIHFEKLRNRVDGAGAVPFEASLESFTGDGRDGIRWCSRDLVAPILKRAAALFADGLTVREVAAILRVSKSEAGRLRIQAMDDGFVTPDEDRELNDHQGAHQPAVRTSRPIMGLSGILVCEAMMMRTDGASYGDRERFTGPAFGRS